MKRRVRKTAHKRLVRRARRFVRNVVAVAAAMCVYISFSMIMHLPIEFHAAMIPTLPMSWSFCKKYAPSLLKIIIALMAACFITIAIPMDDPSDIAAPAPQVQAAPAEPDGPQQVQEQSRIPLVSWEENPFFPRIDEYMGRHVEMDDLEEVLFTQLSMTLGYIEVGGPYDPDILEASEYGEKVLLATLYEGSYNIFTGSDKLRDDQIGMLIKANDQREKANSTYMVCENLKMMGGNAIKLGDLHEDNNEKLECYKAAFGYYQAAYRCAIAESLPSGELDYIVDQLNFISTKLDELDMHNWEASSAPHIVAAFRRLAEL